MSYVISFVGQKGGTGKSTLARAMAVETALKNVAVVIIDLDEGQATSTHWARQRAVNKIEPAIRVISVPRSQLGIQLNDKEIDVSVIDAPGWSDKLTLWLAQSSHVVVIPTRGNTDDLVPSVKLGHELVAGGIAKEDILFVLNAVHDDKQVEEARAFLKEAGFEAIKGAIKVLKSLETAQETGRAITEVSHTGLKARMVELVHELMGKLYEAGERKSLAQQTRAMFEPKRLRIVGRERD